MACFSIPFFVYFSSFCLMFFFFACLWRFLVILRRWLFFLISIAASVHIVTVGLSFIFYSCFQHQPKWPTTCRDALYWSSEKCLSSDKMACKRESSCHISLNDWLMTMLLLSPRFRHRLVVVWITIEIRRKSIVIVWFK